MKNTKIKSMIAGMMILGSLTLVGCSSTDDIKSTEEATTKQEQSTDSKEIVSEDYNEGWNFALDLDKEGLLPMKSKEVSERVFSRYQEGSTDKVQDFYQGYIACTVELGYTDPAAEEALFKYMFATYRMNPANNDYNQEMKQAAALDSAIAQASAAYEAESFYAQIKGFDVNNKDNLIIEVVDQDNNFVERYVYNVGLGIVEPMK